MTPTPGATGRRGGSGAKGSGVGRGRGRGRGAGGGERAATATSAPAAAAVVTPADDAPRSNAKGGGKHDKTKRKGGGNPTAGPNANQQQRPPSSARPARAANAVVRKVLIRNIPHTTEQEEILALVEAHGVTKESVWRFVPGRVRGNNRLPTTGRLYLDLKKDAEQARKLIAALNGHVLSESKESQIALEVEFAPYQKIPREKQRKDAKTGTIDRDPEYLAFLEELNKPKEKLPSAELVADSADPSEVVEKPVSALVKYMNERKVYIRDKGKGKNGKLFEKGSAAKRQTKKKDGKLTKEKGKTSKDRRKATEAAAATDAAKPRKPRATRGTGSNKKESSSESVEPGMVRIMGTKASKATSDSPATANNSASSAAVAAAGTDAKDKGKKASGGAASGGRGKARVSERPPKEPKPAKTSNSAVEGGGGEPKNPRRRDSRAASGAGGGSSAGGKKEGSGKAGGERKKKVFVPKEPSNQSG